LTDMAAQALGDGDTGLLCNAMTECQDLLVQIGVVSDPLLDMISLAKRHGALAVKVTGAGGGGCVLALLPSNRCDSIVAGLRSELGENRIHPIFIP
jgi:mevalonate kinase